MQKTSMVAPFKSETSRSDATKDCLLSMGSDIEGIVTERLCSNVLLGERHFSTDSSPTPIGCPLQSNCDNFMTVDSRHESESVAKEDWCNDTSEWYRKTFTCELCNEICDGKNTLLAHQISAHTDSLYSCSSCHQLVPLSAKSEHICDETNYSSQLNNVSSSLTNCTSDGIVDKDNCEGKYEVTSVAEVYVGSPDHDASSSCTEVVRGDEPTLEVNVTREFVEIEEPVKAKIVDAIQQIIDKRKDYIASVGNRNNSEEGCRNVEDAWSQQPVIYVCPLCENISYSRQELERHKTEHSSAEHMCQYCGKTFKQWNRLRVHERHHRETSKQYTCPQCRKSFRLKASLRDHVQRHSQLRPYKCPTCDKCYGSKTSLDIHLTSHSTERHYLCDLCGKRYKHVSNLQSHRRTHKEDYMEKKFQCEDCDKTFRTKNKLEEHQRIHSGVRPFFCTTCGKAFHKKQQLRQHSAIHSGTRPFHCNICGARFNRKGNLTEHAKKHKVDKKFTCKICKESFSSISLILNHRRSHATEETGHLGADDIIVENTAFPCGVCGKCLASKVSLKTHMRIHTGERPFQCSICGKKFNQKPALDYHYRTHTGERPFRCQFCGQGFNSKLSRDTHCRLHTGEKPFKCETCGMGFRCAASLNQHSVIHTGDRPFGCPYCQKRFRRRDQLTVHIRIHTGERPYACEFCGRAFTQRGDMVKHRRIHTQEKPFMCDLCGRGFKHKRELKSHEYSHTIPCDTVVVTAENLIAAFPGPTIIEGSNNTQLL